MSDILPFSTKTKFALTIAVVLWASAFVGIRAGLLGYSPGSLALFRFIVASICILVIYLRLKNRSHIIFLDKIRLLVIGAIAIGIYHLALNTGEQTVSSGIASFIISQSPIITALIAFIVLRERMNIFAVFGLLVSFSGVTLILFSQDVSIKLEWGNFYVLIAAVAGSIYSVLQKPYLKKYHAIEVTAYLIWGGTLAFLFYIPVLSHEILTASMTATLSVIYLGIFPAAIAYLAWSYALAAMPASRAVNYLYFMPIIATLLGWCMLGEVPPILSLVGGLIALAGVWIVGSSAALRLAS